jgi:hypothetical protein
VYSKFRTESKSCNFERVKHFEYLEVTVSYDNDEEPERMSKGSKGMDSLQRMLTSTEISRAAKIRMIYRTVVRPVMVGIQV